MEEVIARYFEQQARAATSGARARLALEALTDYAGARLRRSARLGGGGEVCVARSALHVRSERGYRALVVCGADEGAEGSVSSATLWRWARQTGGAAGVDIGLRRLHLMGDGDGARAVADLEIDSDQIDASASLRLLFEGDATHVLAAPLHDRGAAPAGMFTLELVAPGAIGRAWIWEELLSPVSLMTTLLSPHLDLEFGEAEDPEDDVECVDDLLPVVGPTMRPRIDLAGRFAGQRETLLLSGPSGSGKSRLARWCHSSSRERGGPFEVLDLLTVPEEMQMAELVGWRRGAFTGASHDMDGAIERARGGTLFIDEIDKLSLKTQAGLLRLLEEGTYRVLGDRREARRADVRFIVGTNMNLAEAVRQGSFREDLYWRINVLPIELPPLDERAEEIIPWARYMLARTALERGMSRGARWSDEALSALRARAWPGNLRQLDNIVRRALVIASTDPSATQGAPALVELTHVRHATRFEHPGATGSGARDGARDELIEQMSRAARSFVRWTRERAGDAPLHLDDASVFRGFVLREAAGEQEDYAEALSLLGQRKLVEHRNHHRLWNREYERLLAFESMVSAHEPSAE